jgi:hypothetical protein
MCTKNIKVFIIDIVCFTIGTMALMAEYLFEKSCNKPVADAVNTPTVEGMSQYKFKYNNILDTK